MRVCSYEDCADDEARKAFLTRSRKKFGSLYDEHCQLMCSEQYTAACAREALGHA